MEETNNNLTPVPNEEPVVAPNIVEEEKKENTVKLSVGLIIGIIFYVVGAICIFIAIKYLNADLDVYGSSQYRFSEHSYVGGDAYNYIISAARSAAVMTKSLIWAVFGCSSVIFGRLISK